MVFVWRLKRKGFTGRASWETRKNPLDRTALTDYLAVACRRY